MSNKECIAVVLAGGQGTRLAPLTTKIPKPAIPFGGKYRLIDFSLSNCINSGIDIVGVLTAKQSLDLNRNMISDTVGHFRIHALPPLSGLSSYSGTANAVYENIDFIDKFSPEFVLVLSGDHVYKMDYGLFLRHHKETKAALTISVMEVPWSEAPRFGIMATNSDGLITDFTEKPLQPKSNLASMGVYLFSWSKLKSYLASDAVNHLSSHDFGKNIIPAMLSKGERLIAYPFRGYWKDVGTVESFYQAHMDLLSDPPGLDIFDSTWPLRSTLTPWAQNELAIKRHHKSIITVEGYIQGKIEKSIIFPGAYIAGGAKVRNSIIMPGARVNHGAIVEKAIIGPGAVVESGCILGGGKQPVAVVAQNAVMSAASTLLGNNDSVVIGCDAC